MLLIGNWSDPKPADSSEDVAVLQQFIQNTNCTCQFCGTKTRLTPQTPMGFFDVCVRDRSLPDEPANWVALCCICSDFNDLEKLEGKGSFVEAPWIKQSDLTSILRLSYAVSLRPEAEWGVIKKASEAVINSIDTVPEHWANVSWDGSVSGLKDAVSRIIHPFHNEAYVNQLRFRFDMVPYEDALRYWAVQLEQLALASNSSEANS